MGVVKNGKSKTKNDEVKNKNNKNIANGKPKSNDVKVKKKKRVSCLQCFKPVKEDGGLEGKYRVAAPELMQDTFMSDSEDEGGEVECPIQQQQQYRYMNSEAGTLHRAKPLEDSVADGHLWPSNNDSRVATMERQPVDIGFLVSFVVDARGGAMKAKRRGGVRIIVPPAACTAPTRVTCRAATRRAPVAAPPPLMEGEALASRLLELQPQGAKFLAPVIIEVPIFTSSSPEREIVVLRSDSGETWQDHYLHNNDNPLIQEALRAERQQHGNTGESVGESGERVTRIVVCDFPHYLAVVSRVRQEVHIVGPEGGTVSSSHIPQVQALFPAQALTKRIRVGVQAHGAGAELARRALPRLAAVSPVVTVEPRRRKFHRAITLTLPLPTAQDGRPEKGSTSNLRLLCSIMGGQARAVWEDVTGSTPLTITEDCASFTTTVSARFWLMNCQNVSDATKLATELYREMLLVPFDVRIVVLGKRLDALEGRLLVLYITDRYAYETLLQQEHYTEVAHSTSVRFLDGKEIYLEFSGNLVPVTKSGSQPMFKFEAFKDNRVEFPVRVKHHEESPSGRIYFMNEPKVPKGEQSQTPACVLDVELPERFAPRAGKSQMDYLNLDQSGFDALKDELSFHWGDHHHSIEPPSLPNIHEQQINGHDIIITNGDVTYPSEENDNIATKPQANGDTLHVDSNKTKATFDSDEDKTPMNTLEKGKKKSDGNSFFGGIADKVKHVFGHVDDKDSDDKEASPKPQPKPRESKEKSPPKPAPRIINEELLDKVEDMFKDLHSKPHQKDEDFDNKVYKTKLVVDEEERPSGLHDIKEEIYEQYENMQPVETPLNVKKSDPFQFYVGCCEGKFKKGQKHRHDETSNVVDRIEQVKFATNEKINQLTDSVQDDTKDSLDKLEKEKDNIKQKSNEVIEDVIAKYSKTTGDIENEIGNVKLNTQETLNNVETVTKDTLKNFSDTGNKIHNEANAKLSNLPTKNIEEIKSSATQNLHETMGKVELTKNDLKDKWHEVNFAAMEKEEEHKCRGIQQLGTPERNMTSHLKHETKKGEIDIGNSIHAAAVTSINNLKDNLGEKTDNLKSEINNTTENIKNTTNDKLNDLGEAIDSSKKKAKKAAKNAKEEVHSEVKKKSKEGKNFFTGLVHNIFGEKDKLENEMKEKISEGKESANNVLDDLEAKKSEMKDSISQKEERIKEDAKNLIHDVKEKKKDVEKELQSTKHDIEQTIHTKKGEVEETINSKKDQAEQAIHNKQDEVTRTIHDKKDEIEKRLHDTINETTKLLEDEKQNIRSLSNKSEDIKRNLQEKKENLENSISQATNELGNTLNDSRHEVENTAKQLENGLLDKKNDIENSFFSKCNELNKEFEGTKHDITTTIESNTDELGNIINENKNKVTNVVVSKTTEVGNAMKDTKDGVKNKTADIGKVMQEKVDDLMTSAKSKTNNISNTLHSTKENVDTEVQSRIEKTGKSIQDKKAEIQNFAESELDRIKQEAEHATEQIKRSAEETLNAAEGKKGQLQENLSDKLDELQKSGSIVVENIQKSASDKCNDLKRTSKQAFDHAQDSTLSTFGKFESSAKDKVNDARDAWEDLHSSTRDTYADFKDDVHGLQSSSQDTLRSFQSSAGNTFDSLEDSAREVIGDIKNTPQNLEYSDEGLFGNVIQTFEGFQVSADNKLEDVKGAANDRLEVAGERLQEVQEDVKDAGQAVADMASSETDKFTSNLNDLGNAVFGISGKGFMKDSSTKLLESEKSQSSPHKKSSGIPKLRKKK